MNIKNFAGRQIPENIMKKIALAIQVMVLLSSTGLAGDLEDYQRFENHPVSEKYLIDFSEYKLGDYPADWELKKDRQYDVHHRLDFCMKYIPFGTSGTLERLYCVGGLFQEFKVPYSDRLATYNVAFFPNTSLAHRSYEAMLEAVEKDVRDAKAQIRKERLTIGWEGYRCQIYDPDGKPITTVYLFRKNMRVYYIMTPPQGEEYFNRIAPVQAVAAAPTSSLPVTPSPSVSAPGTSPLPETRPSRIRAKPSLARPRIPGTPRIPRWVLPGVGSAVGLGVLAGLAVLLKSMLASSAAKAAAAAAPKISIKPKAAPVKQSPKIKFAEQQQAAETEEEKEEKKKRVVARIEIMAQPAEIVADGKSKARLTFKVFDSDGRPVPGETIRFQLSRDAHKLPPTAITDGRGEIHLEYTSSTEERTIAIIAHSTSNPQVTQVVKIKEKKPKLAEIILEAQPDEVVANGKSKSQIKINAIDEARHPVKGERIDLWFEHYDGSKIEPSLVVTDANGRAQATFTAGSHKGEQKVSAQAKSRDVRAQVMIKLKEEIYYEVRDNWSGFKVRVNIPNKGLNIIRGNEVLGARVLDNLENEVKAGFSGGLIDLAALIGYYGINSDIVYTTKANNWRKVHMECSRVTGELEKGLEVGLGVGLMTFTSSVAITIAEAFGGKLISLGAKVLGKADKKVGKSKMGLETQEKVYSIIQKEKRYYERMASIAEDLASNWSQLNHSGGNPDAATRLMNFDSEIEFYELNNKVLAVAEQKGRITESFSESDYGAIRKDMQNINQTVIDARSELNKIKSLENKVKSFVI